MNKEKLLKHGVSIFALILGFCLAFLSWWAFIANFNFQNNLDYAYSQEDIY